MKDTFGIELAFAPLGLEIKVALNRRALPHVIALRALPLKFAIIQ